MGMWLDKFYTLRADEPFHNRSSLKKVTAGSMMLKVQQIEIPA